MCEFIRVVWKKDVCLKERVVWKNDFAVELLGSVICWIIECVLSRLLIPARCFNRGVNYDSDLSLDRHRSGPWSVHSRYPREPMQRAAVLRKRNKIHRPCHLEGSHASSVSSIMRRLLQSSGQMTILKERETLTRNEMEESTRLRVSYSTSLQSRSASSVTFSVFLILFRWFRKSKIVDHASSERISPNLRPRAHNAGNICKNLMEIRRGSFGLARKIMIPTTVCHFSLYYF